MIVQVLNHFVRNLTSFLNKDERWFFVAMSISYFVNKVESLRFTLNSY